MVQMERRYPKLGPYSLLHRLAVGGMAEVFLAHNAEAPEGEQLVVVKQIREDLTNNREFVDMFLDEERVISSLHHPNIVRIHDFGEARGRYYLVLEYVWGESLGLLTSLCVEQKVRFPASAAIYIASEVAAALEHAHQHRDSMGYPAPVIHRDVTLGNVVISYTGQVKILDFGIAKAKGRLAETRAGHVKGTLGYLAPEQIQGLPVGPWTDIYQLGVLLYHAVVGRAPLAASRDVELMGLIAKGAIPRPTKLIAGFPPLLERVIMRALAKDPEDRYPSAAAFRDVLRQLVAPVLPKAAASLGRLMLRITGDRYQRQQAFISTLFAGQRRSDESANLFAWAFNEADPQTESTQFSVDIDTDAMDPEATSRVSIEAIEAYTRQHESAQGPNTEVNALQSGDFDPPKTDAEQVDPARLEFPDLTTELSQERLRDLHGDEDSQVSLGSIPRPVSGIFNRFHAEAKAQHDQDSNAPKTRDDDESSQQHELDLSRLSDVPEALPEDLDEADYEDTVEVSQKALQRIKENYKQSRELELTRRKRRLSTDSLATQDLQNALAHRDIDDIRDEPTQIESAQQRSLPGSARLNRTDPLRDIRLAGVDDPAVPVDTDDAPILLQAQRQHRKPTPRSSPGLVVMPETDPGQAAIKSQKIQQAILADDDNALSVALREALGEAPEVAASISAPTVDIVDEVTAPKHPIPPVVAPPQARQNRAVTPPERHRSAQRWDRESELDIDVRRFRNPLSRVFGLGLLGVIVVLLLAAIVAKPKYTALVSDGFIGFWQAIAGPASPTDTAPENLVRDASADSGRDSPDSGPGDFAAEDVADLPNDAARPNPSPKVVKLNSAGHDNRIARPAGQLRIEGSQELGIVYRGQRHSGRATISLQGNHGQLRLSEAGLQVRLNYEVIGPEIKFHVTSQPSAKLSYNGLQVGETPKAMMIGTQFKIEILGFAAGQRMRVTVDFSPL